MAMTSAQPPCATGSRRIQEAREERREPRQGLAGEVTGVEEAQFDTGHFAEVAADSGENGVVALPKREAREEGAGLAG